MNTKTETVLPVSVLTKSQTKQFGPVLFKEHDHEYRIIATVRHNDQCGNGHNTFSITAQIDEKDGRGAWRDYSGGCCHDEIAKHFPTLAPFIKWHLTSTDGPMHYVANVIYMAGERDYNGLLKGQFRQHTSRGQQNNGVAGVPNWTLEFPEGLATDVYATEKPKAVTLEWQAYGITGEGKARELDAARRGAVWPDATDAELSVEPEQLKAALLKRLPALMEQFKKDVESLGFVY